MDESALLDAVLRVKLGGSAKTAAQVHAALEAEGTKVTLSQIKKACSKVAKRGGLASEL
eukprot:CAMPEP_0119337326 /NCGR_PEP_ID=MMETSP1333-20130426/93752_1 /TAXON_ID=418940 /ORGANISM="Scyphosphaera apsteinii, Strain RCC1455" /LENGTH=58 /DNA_ID=CAMNT_0007348335 /DNA_START=9 /DNA_END=182 /DNA_ORIENTATION=-